MFKTYYKKIETNSFRSERFRLENDILKVNSIDKRIESITIGLRLCVKKEYH